MSRPRTACSDCALPFYSDTNDSCPYCGAAAPTDATAAPGRERVTCADCGLPHYADAGECPYCATAQAAGGASGTVGDSGGTETDAASSTMAEPARERVTCGDCGLAHYADADECPYCAMAAANTAAAPAESAAEAEAASESDPESEPAAETEPEPEPEAASDSAEEEVPPVQRRRERRQSDAGNRTVVGRVLGAVRSLFGR